MKRTRKRVWLSVDWDFFQEERIEWDWSHAERGEIYSQIVWLTRPFHRGDDIRPLTSPDRYEPKASTFWKRFSLVKCSADTLAICDSHAVGLPYFYQLGKVEGVADEIWNFDAHHDLGYVKLPLLKKYVKAGKAEAGSWLYVLMKNYKKLRCKHIYPVWKKPDVEQCPWLEDADIKRRTEQLSAGQFDEAGDVEITGLLIAKSEAWSPSWNDRDFSNFVLAAVQHLPVAAGAYGPTNAMTERAWDEAGFQAYRAEVERFRKGAKP